MARALNPVLVAIAVSGCSVDLAEPRLETSSFVASVVVADTLDNRRVAVGGELILAPLIWDMPAAIEDSALIVSGSPIMPIVNSQGTVFSYDRTWRWSDLGIANGSITIQPPRLAGSAYGPATLVLPERDGDRDLLLPLNQDLVLNLATSNTLQNPEPEHQIWEVRLRHEGGVVALNSIDGPPPSMITMPAAWLQEFTDAFTAELRIGQQMRVGENPDSYVVGVNVIAILHWNVTRPEQ